MWLACEYRDMNNRAIARMAVAHPEYASPHLRRLLDSFVPAPPEPDPDISPEDATDEVPDFEWGEISVHYKTVPLLGLKMIDDDHNLKGRDIMEEECRRYGVTFAMIRSQRRDKRVVFIRHKIMYRMYAETGLSMPQIGRLMHRDHTAVLHGIRRHMARMASMGMMEAAE